MACNECSCQCAEQKNKIKEVAKKFQNPVAIMNQATYEAVTGNVLDIDWIPVEINQDMRDRTFLITGQYLGEL